MQPIQVKAYARVHLRRAKNDKLDAVLIAACAATIEQPRIEPDERLAKLAQHLTFVEQIEEDIARIKVRLEHVGDPRLRRMVMADIARLKARRSAELLRIVEALRVHNDLARRLDLVLSVPGIGERTALALIIRMPEIGQVSREEAAALAGLAPFDDDSGKHKGQRHIAGGRGRLRRWLYAAALPEHFVEKRFWSRSTPASPRAAKPTTQPSLPVPESSSSMPIPSSNVEHLGPKTARQLMVATRYVLSVRRRPSARHICGLRFANPPYVL